MNKQEIEKALSWFEPELNSQESAYAFAIANGQDTDKCFEDWLGYMRTAVECMEQQLTGGWIPVTEQLPEEGRYLVTTVYEKVKESKFDLEKWWQIDNSTVSLVWEEEPIKVMAWRPLPEPWREGK